MTDGTRGVLAAVAMKKITGKIIRMRIITGERAIPAVADTNGIRDPALA
jgi:hypothetical protein